jgi:hypothetical protein
MFLKHNNLPHPNRLIGLPVTADGMAPTISASYGMINADNMISVKYFPKMGVGVIYETE